MDIEFIKKEIKETSKQLEKTQEKLKFLQSKLYLSELWKTATYKNWGEDRHEKPQIKLFSINPHCYALSGELLDYVKEGAQYTKDMSSLNKAGEVWPKWKKEAYKQAKIFQQYYNKYIKE